MTWALIVWSVLMLMWIIVGAGNEGESASEYCRTHKDAYLSIKDCESFHHAGAGIGIAALIVVWFFGFIVLSLIWFMTRPKGRECPVCGESVKRGRTVCANCGYDFAGGMTEKHG